MVEKNAYHGQFSTKEKKRKNVDKACNSASSDMMTH
jgi:hypothetical protein